MLRWFTAKKSQAAAQKTAPKRLSLEERVKHMKQEALARASEAVRSGREPAAFGDKPGLSHYIRAMMQVCTESGLMLPARSILDLSGLTIDGFAFTSDDFAIAQEEINRFASATEKRHA